MSAGKILTIPNLKEKLPLTPSQRRWLESLSKEDIHPYPETVRDALKNGHYGYFGQLNLRDLVINYKMKHNL